MESFRGVDYYGIEALLTEEQRMVRDAITDGALFIRTEKHLWRIGKAAE